MKLVLYGTFLPVDQMVDVAVEAERLGFDGLSFPDHVIYPMSLDSDYPYKADGKPHWTAETEWPDPFVAITAMAMRTIRLRFMTGILVLPLRHPLMVAKSASTLSLVSGGRFDLGIGVGWMKEEFEALGVSPAGRGKRTDEAIEIMRKAWTPEAFEHHGDTYDFEPVRMSPTPDNPVPIYIGGGSEAALDRAARLGDGFLPPLGSVERTAEYVTELESRRRALGRDGAFEIVGSALACDSPEQIEELEAIGVTAVHVDPFSLQGLGHDAGLADRLEALNSFHIDVIDPLRGGGTEKRQKWI